MPITRVPLLRIGGHFAAVAAVLAMGVVSCASVTGGQPEVDAGDAPAYRTSVSVSLSQSAASSSERQASLTAQAIHDTCDTLSATSSDAIDAVNTYVDAFNEGSDSVAATEGPAVDALEQSAAAVTGSITKDIPPDLKDALDAWAQSAKATAKSISDQESPAEFNNAVEELNDARSTVLELCDAH